MSDLKLMIYPYLISAILGLILFLVKREAKRTADQFKKTNEIFQALQNSQKALIRNEIIQAYEFGWQKGEIGIYVLQNVEALYTEYRKLGGNSFIEEVMKDVRKLPKSTENFNNNG